MIDEPGLAARAESTFADATVLVLAKPPLPGLVKTRLEPCVGPSGAAALAGAFLADTWALVRSLGGVRPVLATTTILPGFCELAGGEQWLQGDGDLGARLERVLRRALEGTPRAIAIGADTPGLPRSLLERAHEHLARADAVLGPCVDGGFYLIGLRRCARGLLADLPWSTERTYAATLARLMERGLRTAVLPPWFDVDRPEDLVELRRRLDRGEIEAPRTAESLARVGLGKPHCQ